MPLDHFDHQAKLIIDNQLKKKKKNYYIVLPYGGGPQSGISIWA